MTHEEAVKECERLSAGDATSVWAPQQQENGDWAVARVRVGGFSLKRGKFTPESKPPPDPPRENPQQGPNPLWGGGN
jgi:hypothetical protein